MGRTDTLTLEEFMMKLASLSDEDAENWIIALRAAESMSKRWQEDAAVLSDFRVVKLKTNEEPPLEIVRYSP